jgi:hypothetical protein
MNEMLETVRAIAKRERPSCEFSTDIDSDGNVILEMTRPARWSEGRSSIQRIGEVFTYVISDPEEISPSLTKRAVLDRRSVEMAHRKGSAGLVPLVFNATTWMWNQMEVTP